MRSYKTQRTYETSNALQQDPRPMKRSTRSNQTQNPMKQAKRLNKTQRAHEMINALRQDPRALWNEQCAQTRPKESMKQGMHANKTQ